MHQLSPQDEDDCDELWNMYNNTWGFSSSSNASTASSLSPSPVTSPLQLLMVPINDNNRGGHDVFQTCGNSSHWSLLVVFIISKGNQLN